MTGKFFRSRTADKWFQPTLIHIDCCNWMGPSDFCPCCGTNLPVNIPEEPKRCRYCYNEVAEDENVCPNHREDYA